MNVITRKRLLAWCREYRDAKSSLMAWYDIAKGARWDNLQQVRADFPTADGVHLESGSIVTVFNIRGNTYRMIAAIHYDKKRVYLLRFQTHAEHDKAKWKAQL